VALAESCAVLSVLTPTGGHQLLHLWRDVSYSRRVVGHHGYGCDLSNREKAVSYHCIGHYPKIKHIVSFPLVSPHSGNGQLQGGNAICSRVAPVRLCNIFGDQQARALCLQALGFRHFRTCWAQGTLCKAVDSLQAVGSCKK
jgi:hypothetical protein